MNICFNRLNPYRFWKWCISHFEPYSIWNYAYQWWETKGWYKMSPTLDSFFYIMCLYVFVLSLPSKSTSKDEFMTCLIMSKPNLKDMLIYTTLIWTIWTPLSTVQERPLNLITHLYHTDPNRYLQLIGWCNDYKEYTFHLKVCFVKNYSVAIKFSFMRYKKVDFFACDISAVMSNLGSAMGHSGLII